MQPFTAAKSRRRLLVLGRELTFLLGNSTRFGLEMKGVNM